MNSTNLDSDSDGKDVSPKNSKKMYRKQKFKNEWLGNDKFKGWLDKIEGNVFNCKCLACNKILKCGKSDLEKHSETKLHKQNVKSVKISIPVTNFFANKQKSQDEQREVLNFELKLSLFFAEHNVALQIVDHLLPLLKEIVPDSKIIKNAKLGRKKCTSVIKNVLAKEERDKLVETLKTTKFSIMIDESTDIGINKCMCVLVRFLDENGKAVVKLLDLLPVGSDCTSAALYKSFRDLILNLEIPFKNIIGMCSDGASVMVGSRNSFASRLKEDNSAVTIVKCICHSSAIIASKACLSLPRAPEELLRQIGNYVSGSSKRCSQLADFQINMQQEKKKILRTSGTRWLSHQKCIERILDNWLVLQNYFKEATLVDKLKSSEVILKELSNECNKAYLYFLKYVLNYFNSLNALFQSKKPLIHQLHSESVKIFLKLGQNFIKKQELKVNCSVRSPHIFLPIDQIFLGPECSELLLAIPEAESHRIKLDCLEFYIVALEEIQNRLPISPDSIFGEIAFLNPEVVLGINDSIRAQIKFKYISLKYKLNEIALLQEWRSIEYHFSDAEKENLKILNVEDFWHKLDTLKSFNDEIEFPILCKLAKLALALPHANADAERIFSIVTDVRTKKRNKLSHENLNAICIVRSSLQNSDKNCVSFKFTENHFKQMRAVDLYDHHHKEII